MLAQFYAYIWLREDGTPYYVGKGCENRAFIRHRKGVLSPPRDKGRILILNRSSEQEAFITEAELICNWGRKDIGTGCLHNVTDGGEGISGYNHTQKAKDSMTLHRFGNTYSIGSVRSPEFKKNLANQHKGKKWSAESIAKRVSTRRARGGFTMSAESKEKESLTKFLKTVAWG